MGSYQAPPENKETRLPHRRSARLEHIKDKNTQPENPIPSPKALLPATTAPRKRPRTSPLTNHIAAKRSGQQSVAPHLLAVFSTKSPVVLDIRGLFEAIREAIGCEVQSYGVFEMKNNMSWNRGVLVLDEAKFNAKWDSAIALLVKLAEVAGGPELGVLAAAHTAAHTCTLTTGQTVEELPLAQRIQQEVDSLETCVFKDSVLWGEKPICHDMRSMWQETSASFDEKSEGVKWSIEVKFLSCRWISTTNNTNHSTTNTDSKRGEFELFQKLPIEIRLKIWGLTLKPVLIKHKHKKGKGIYFVRTVPAVLQVCQESRQEFLQKHNVSKVHPTYKLCRDLGTKGLGHLRSTIYISMELDTVDFSKLRVFKSKDFINIRNISIDRWDVKTITPQIIGFKHLESITITGSMTGQLFTLPLEVDGELDLDHLGSLRCGDQASIKLSFDKAKSCLEDAGQKHADWTMPTLKIRALERFELDFAT